MDCHRQVDGVLPLEARAQVRAEIGSRSPDGAPGRLAEAKPNAENRENHRRYRDWRPHVADLEYKERYG